MQQRVAFEDYARWRAPIVVFRIVQSFAEQWHALREKSLLGAQPEGAPCPRGQETAAVGFIRALLPTNGTDVIVRGAIAILAVLRADSVPILGNLSCDPIFVGKSGD